MIKKILIIFFILGCIFDVSAKTLSSVNLGLRYSSVFEKRGVIFYKGYQVDPILAVFLFDDKLEFLGDSIGYRDFIYNDSVRLRTRLVSISDNAFFPNEDSQKTGLPNRADSFEFENSLEFFLPGYNKNYLAEFDLTHSYEFAAHKGQYIELKAKLKLFDFNVPLLKTQIEPNLLLSGGWGDEKTNSYYYGPSANKSGVSNLAYGLWFAFPGQSDRYYPIVQIKRFEATNEFKDAEFSKNNSEGWQLSFIASTGVLDWF